MKKFEVKNHEPSYLTDGDWRLVWHDEFDGTELDTSKWGFRLNFWGEPFDAYTDKGVVLDGNSHIELHRTEKNGCYVSPRLQTGSNSFDIPKGSTDNPWGQNEFYCDGELVSCATENVSHVPQFILLTTEVQGYRTSKPIKVEGEFKDDAFIVDFVRVFDRV